MQERDRDDTRVQLRLSLDAGLMSVSGMSWILVINEKREKNGYDIY